jgi:tetratricopeptide (TPR) repeat protein
MHPVNNNLNVRRPLLFILFLFFIWGCSTQKNTFVSRNFHSITTKYNGFFNARESYQDGLRQLERAHVDNYEDVLSIFRYGSAQQASLVSGKMDVSYQKASIAIRRHSMNIKGVEYNRWIDDSYFLIARSHYFKNDINLSILTFQYIVRQFDTPLKYHSKVWVAKAQIKGQQYTQALQTLERISRDIDEGLLDKEAILLYNMVFADLYLQQRNFSQAVPYLEAAASLASSKKQKTRLTYILAQSYHQMENYAMAQQSYRRVLKLNPEFQMAFQARINMAMSFDVKSGDSGFILSELQGMLKDNRNREFRDQIYYALGQFSMRQNNQSQAITYYNQSLENYRGNRSQKGVTFLRLSEIHFNNNNYLKAADLYDSTMIYISPEYPQYQAAGSRNTVLKDLAVNLRRIEREDSLQQLARLSPAERNVVLDRIVEQVQEEERRAREIEQERAQMRQQMARSGRSQAPGEGEGGWYFYNPSAISFGRNEFFARWGERELNDLWRVSNKRIISFGDPNEGFAGQEEQEASGGISRASLMQNIPLTPEQLQASNDRIAQSYYNAALIYKDKLSNNEQAVKNLEALVSRFPQNENKLLGSYFLHQIYRQMGNTARADQYKNLIIREFTDTDFARILSDPQYREKLAIKENQIQELYNTIYSAYESGNYDYALSIYNQNQTESPDISREQAAQFAYLKALILAKTNAREELISQLNHVTQNYTQTRVHEPATNLLAYLGSGTAGLVTSPGAASATGGDGRATPGSVPASTVFSYNPQAVHFFVMVVNTRTVQIRQIRNAVNTFNRDNFDNDDLNLSTLFFDQGRQLITVTNFPNAELAMIYGRQVINELSTKEFDTSAYSSFIISVDNYPVFYQERKFDEYRDFFNATYPAFE